MQRFIILLIAVLLLAIPGCDVPQDVKEEVVGDYIQPDLKNPYYWNYKGVPVMLLGGSAEDNLFQYPNVEEHLDLLRSVGGNYVRNTMSSRDSGNVWPFARGENGQYDLYSWNTEYWQRLDRFLKATSERDIIVQLEVWATFDFYRKEWDRNPFNPKNNSTYNAMRSGLPEEVKTHPIFTENPFFWSIPNANSSMKLLWHQQLYVDKLLSYTMQYPNVLYCMDNETSVTAEWGKFWSDYIRKVGKENGLELHTTEMWDPWELDHVAHRETIDHPEIYSFIDISQNNHNTGDKHWDQGIRQIERVRMIDAIRPLNNVKVYGNDGGRHQTTQNAISSFVRNTLFGAASTRFHRPNSGQGLNEVAQAVIKSMRSIVDSTDFFAGVHANDYLKDREEGEAFCRRIGTSEFIVFFPQPGSVSVDLEGESGEANLVWIDLLTGRWGDENNISFTDEVAVEAPNANQIALIRLE